MISGSRSPTQDGRRRLDDPDDFVRLEIEAALTRNVRVIPILVDGARMPRADELPPSLAGLVRRQALELSPARFDFDTSRLLKVLDRTLAEVRTAHDRCGRDIGAGREGAGLGHNGAADGAGTAGAGRTESNAQHPANTRHAARGWAGFGTEQTARPQHNRGPRGV